MLEISGIYILIFELNYIQLMNTIAKDVTTCLEYISFK